MNLLGAWSVYTYLDDGLLWVVIVESLSCVRLWDPMDCSTPEFPVHHQLLKLSQTHVHWVSDATQPSHLVILFSSFQSFPATGSFQMSQFFTSGGQSIGVSASASVLPVNIQSWFPLGLTGWISLQSKKLLAQWWRTYVPEQEAWVWSLGGEDSLERNMAIHSSTLAWEILWTEEPGGLQSMGSQ